MDLLIQQLENVEHLAKCLYFIVRFGCAICRALRKLAEDRHTSTSAKRLKK